jgi:hypothetical protein
MKQWAMKEIKEVVTLELDNTRKGHTIQIELLCPAQVSLVTMNLEFWYQNPQHRLERSFFTLWEVMKKHVQEI